MLNGSSGLSFTAVLESDLSTRELGYRVGGREAKPKRFFGEL
jgi:hypothetical protein